MKTKRHISQDQALGRENKLECSAENSRAFQNRENRK